MNRLHWQILAALLLAVAAGSLAGTHAGIFGVRYYAMFDFIGTLFLNALKMLIVPLVVSSIITGIAGNGSAQSLEKIGAKTVLYYMTTSLLAILVGLAVVDIVSPGLSHGLPAKLGLSADANDVASKVAGRGMGDIAGIFLRMIPPNLVAAAADGQMLGLIFFSLLFGFFMAKIEEAKVMHAFWQGLFQVMMKITQWVMKFAPIGVFGLVAKVVAGTGFSVFKPLLWFFFSVMIGLSIHFFLVLPTLLLILGNVTPFRHFRIMAPALLTAFYTSSSAATIPVT
ncbi:MAG TPA: cation:dicarboxylase symporter family transporter, partial [Burkholderiales bacterium]|nr:cation:dicarboxylase symporter family transporter [Burkholderiales bacterium]